MAEASRPSAATNERRRARLARLQWISLTHIVEHEFDDMFNDHPPTSEGLDYLLNSGVHHHAS